MEVCPVCGVEALVVEAGCYTCMACGYSKCEYISKDAKKMILDFGGEDAKVHSGDRTSEDSGEEIKSSTE